MRLLSLSFVVALVAACSSSSSSSSAPATTKDVDDAAAASAKAWCDKVFACCDAAAQKTLMNAYAGGDVDQAGCTAGVVDHLSVETKAIKDALTLNKLTMSVDKAKSCRDDLGKEACADFFRLGTLAAPTVACSAAFGGTVKEGEPCVTDAVCASGFCPPGDARKCAKVPAAGDPCNATGACGPTMFCQYFIDPKACTKSTTGGTCAPLGGKADGESCCANEECNGLTCLNSSKGRICSSQYALKCGG